MGYITNTRIETQILPRRMPRVAALLVVSMPLAGLVALRPDAIVAFGQPIWFACAALGSLLTGLAAARLVCPAPLMCVGTQGLTVPRDIGETIHWTDIKQIDTQSFRGALGDQHDQLIISFHTPQRINWRKASRRRAIGDVPQTAIAIDIGMKWPYRAGEVKAEMLRAASNLAEVDTQPTAPTHTFWRRPRWIAAGCTAVLLLSIIASHIGAIGVPRLFAQGLAHYEAGNITMALPHLQNDARAGDGRSSYALGTVFLNGDGVDRNLALSTAWFKQGATDGDALSAFRFGEALRLGLGTPVDTAGAVHWLTRAANDNVPEAAFSLSRLYRLGNGVRRDYDVALKWLRRSAGLEYPAAERDLGRLYHEGIALERDVTAALQWYVRAAERGYLPARFDLARLLLDSGPDERALGIAHLVDAAESGYAPAQRRLAQHFLTGQDVPQDPVAAYQWISLATRAWPAESRTDVIREKIAVSRQLSLIELGSAKTRIRAWRPKRPPPAH